MVYFEIILAFISIVLLSYIFRAKDGNPTDWPILGMLPALAKNLHRLHECLIEILNSTNQLNFHVKGPWFSDLDILASVDPSNVHYVMSKKFDKYHKGPKFKEIFAVFGDGMLNTDGHIWEYHQEKFLCFIGHPQFNPFFSKVVREKVVSGLIPVLDHVARLGIEVDLQDLFVRFSLDTICTLVLGQDPKYLSTKFPDAPIVNAIDNAARAIMYRLVMPTWVWKLQRWFAIGLEKKHKDAWQTIDNFLYPYISRKKEQMRRGDIARDKAELADLLTMYVEDEHGPASMPPTDTNNDKFIRDAMLAVLVAGRDTTATTLSWFFFILSQDHQVLSKIKQELDTMAGTTTQNNGKEEQIFPSKTILEGYNDEKLVYLHSALCETLRLYPPVVIEGKAPIETDILPSGHKVHPRTLIAFDMYAMARMKSLWGDDCNEFKPERWISPGGKIKYQPANKFLAFSAGPRTCLGKHLAFEELKLIATSIIQNFNIHPVEGCIAVPDFSIILRMKNGFKVKVTKLA